MAVLSVIRFRAFLLPAIVLACAPLICGCGPAAYGKAIPPTEPLSAAYVLTPGSGQVVAIDRERLEILSFIPVGHMPTDMVSLREGSVVYALSPSAGTISVIDTRRVMLMSEIEGPSPGERLYGAPDGEAAYLLSAGGRSFTAIDTRRHEIVSSTYLPSAAGDVEMLFEESRAFCMLPRKGRIAVVDISRSRVVDTIMARFSAGLSVHASGSDYFYAGTSERTYVDVISISRLGVMNRLQLAGLPGALIEVSCGDLSRVCIAVPDANVVTIFDSAVMKRIADVTCPFAPAALAAGESGEVLVVAGSAGEVAFVDMARASLMSSPVDVGTGTPVLVPVPESDLMIAVDEEGTVSRLNLETASIDATVAAAAPSGTDAVALDTERMWLYVGSADQPEVVVVDIETFTVIAVLKLEAVPTKIILVTCSYISYVPVKGGAEGCACSFARGGSPRPALGSTLLFVLALCVLKRC